MDNGYFHLKPRDGARVLTGSNAVLLLDGKPIKGVTELTLKLKAGGMAELSLKIIGPIEVEGEVEVSASVDRGEPDEEDDEQPEIGEAGR